MYWPLDTAGQASVYYTIYTRSINRDPYFVHLSPDSPCGFRNYTRRTHREDSYTVLIHVYVWNNGIVQSVVSLRSLKRQSMTSRHHAMHCDDVIREVRGIGKCLSHCPQITWPTSIECFVPCKHHNLRLTCQRSRSSFVRLGIQVVHQRHSSVLHRCPGRSGRRDLHRYLLWRHNRRSCSCRCSLSWTSRRIDCLMSHDVTSLLDVDVRVQCWRKNWRAVRRCGSRASTTMPWQCGGTSKMRWMLAERQAWLEDIGDSVGRTKYGCRYRTDRLPVLDRDTPKANKITGDMTQVWIVYISVLRESPDLHGALLKRIVASNGTKWDKMQTNYTFELFAAVWTQPLQRTNGYIG